ncbi:MarR family winged helix-turn-helix transcriptional regulator [Paenibacillus septentrionalis]|uniref:MarR family winged helix-turn-helix transcriptional regulator n=1 Tax=Paenibacillus septentrionalis TaxID=429342 RepID=A0ABW1V8N6_9BACL
MEQQMDVRDVINEMRAVQQQSKQFMERLTEHAQLSSNHVMLLMDLKLNGSMRITEISERFSITAGAATSMCDKLEQQQLVKRIREHQDRRVVQVALTEEGEKIIDLIFESLPAERLLEMLRIFKQIRNLMSTII